MSGYKFDYEEKVWGGAKLRMSPIYFRASRLYWALKEIPDKNGKLLDIGCGVGDFIESFNYYRPGMKISAVDISKKAISLAKERKIKAEFKVANAQKLPFKNNSFDVVTCFDLIEHVQYPTKAIKEIFRVLKPGGIFHALIPTEAEMISIQGPLIRLGWKGKEIYGGHPHHFSKKQVVGWMEKAGFEIKKIRWEEHFTKQILEIFYFSWLSLRGKNVKNTVEGYLSTAKLIPEVRLLRFCKNILAAVSYYEARLLFWFPGLGIHITCRKK